MKRHTFLVLAVLVPSIVLASGERAGADLITFEVIPDVTALGTFFDGTPVPVEARLSDQLRSQGVSFSSTAGYVALVNLGAVGIAVLFSVLPALRAALLHPVQALRYE